MFQYQQHYDQLPPAAALFHPPQLMPPAIFYRRHCRRTGKVKFFNMAKGYGFIIPNQSQYPQEQQHELTPYKKASPSSSSSINEPNKPNRVEEGMCICMLVRCKPTIPSMAVNVRSHVVFVHHTSILSLNKGYLATLNKGEEVEYELHDGPKGIYALYVTGLHGRYLDCNKYNAIDYSPANATNAIAATTTSSSSSTTTTTQQHDSAEYHHHISELTNSFPPVPSHHNAITTTASLPVGNSGTYPMPSLYHHHHHHQHHQQQQQHFVTYIIPHHHHYL
ncbi:hypothetical protein MBANPS3_001327 [Mucor bainieri]